MAEARTAGPGCCRPVRRAPGEPADRYAVAASTLPRAGGVGGSHLVGSAMFRPACTAPEVVGVSHEHAHGACRRTAVVARALLARHDTAGMLGDA